MLLIHTQKLTPRIDYIFKHICTRILGVKVQFTSVIEAFISHEGPKLSYGKQPMGNEFFIKSHGLLQETGFEDQDIVVQPWEDTVCFFATTEKSAIPFDLFSAAFYLLSRYEEYVPHVKDELRRFPASESLAFQQGFLEQPVIDIWAHKFKKIIQQFFPMMVFVPNPFTVHHLVDAGQPFQYGQRGFLRNVIGYSNDLVKFRIRSLLKRSNVLLRLRKDPHDTFTWLMNSSKNGVSKLTVFFLLGEGFSFAEDFNTKRKKFRELIKFVSDYHEVGLLFSYHSTEDYEALKQQKQQLEELTHRPLESAMNDRLLVNLPHNYRNLLELEVKKDCTMLYSDYVGFRASTCTPFLFYDLDYEIKTPLIIHPVAGKSSALYGRRSGEIEAKVNQLRRAVEQVNGTFSLLFTNTDFTSERKNKIWKHFFAEI